MSSSFRRIRLTLQCPCLSLIWVSAGLARRQTSPICVSELVLLLSIALGSFHLAGAKQQPFLYTEDEEPFYEFKWPIRKVAVIGAGVGGLITYRTLTQAGYEVQLFERDCHPGGVWHYTEEKPLNAPVPNLKPYEADYSPSLPPEGKASRMKRSKWWILRAKRLSIQKRAHRAPKPVWESLHSNAPAPDQQIGELRWPEDLPWEISQKQLSRYVRSFASYHGLNTNDGNPNVFYNTRVELIEKRIVDGAQIGWTLTTRWWKEDFDAVAIATGRYNSPSVPPMPGLAEWAAMFPANIHHSRQYRRPEEFQNKSVLIVGAASSGAEIGAGINTFASKVYVSTRPDTDPRPHYPLSFFLPFLPKNTTMIPEIKKLHSLEGKSALRDGKIELVNGTAKGVDEIILCTGFRYTYPFLPQYLNPSLGPNDTAPTGSPQPLVTDGSHVRSLHLDVFYIEEPTLGFVNINGGMQSFVYAEYIAAAFASIYGDRVKEKGGFSKYFLFLGSAKADDMMRYFVSWLNEAAFKYGDPQINAPSKASQEILAIWSLGRFGTRAFNDANDKAPVSGVMDTFSYKDKVWDDIGSIEQLKRHALDAMLDPLAETSHPTYFLSSSSHTALDLGSSHFRLGNKITAPSRILYKPAMWFSGLLALGRRTQFWSSGDYTVNLHYLQQTHSYLPALTSINSGYMCSDGPGSQ
ncbi:nucleotide-binding domain-containing protein [Gymnopus androsaceus JB14]|uniref:Nucleotide-binding domain-containing protein n=1 Tax=Gymnopus androsaceus JB14 TaxID=1447944 RepID=A0A6A4I6Z9_9AGAR|nr:nucleotide-binding domain-containing protein [Gymnopus androsaceus JB14]